jgi:sulfur-oxidizing protein SoxY
MTNVRINAYTDLRVISENNYDALRYNKQYIKAAGGCSAPPVLTSDQPFGTINLIQSSGWTKIKIWHPNFSGMQFDQLTRTEIPAEYIENVQLYVEDKLVWEYNGSIGIAQDVFFMMPIHTEGKHVVIYARDNLGNEFEYDNTY